MLRQIILASIIALAPMAFPGSLAKAAELGDDGLHKEDWFQVTFKDVADDIRAADADGKRLAIVFEQRGCIYCRKMHEELLSDPQIRDYIRANYNVVQYNLFGDEAVTDLDGKELTEKSAARRWHVVFTPTILFMPDKVPAEGMAADAAVATMPGAFGKQTFLHMFEWVREKGYETDEHFQKYHARKLQESGVDGLADE